MNTDGSEYIEALRRGQGEEDEILSPTTIILGEDAFIYGSASAPDHSNLGYSPGALFRIDESGVKILHLFTEYADGSNAQIEDGGDGFIYGVSFTPLSGRFGYQIFKIKYDGSELTVKKDIGGYAFFPEGLTATSAGEIIGMSRGGGTFGKGFVYKIRTDLTGIDVIYSFGGVNGIAPFGKLAEGQDGNFYGTTMRGGNGSFGTIFKVSPTGQYTKLLDFDGNNGRWPQGGLVQDEDGFLYGTTSKREKFKNGIVYRIKPDGNEYTRLYEFDEVPGWNPSGDIFLGNDGFLYGQGFRIKKDGTGFEKLDGGRTYFLRPDGLTEPDVYVTSPADGSANTPTTLTVLVKELYGSQNYILELSESSNFNDEFIQHTSATNTFEISGLRTATTYYARVKSSLWPEYGPTTSFTTGASGVVLEIQEKLWGINEGQIFQVNKDGSGYLEIPISDAPNLWVNGLRKGADGSMYLGGYGVIYKYNPVTKSVEKFPIEEQQAQDFFVENDGTIYGLGGSTFFKIQNGTYTVLYDFVDWLDNYPTLTDGEDGKVYISAWITGIISIDKDGSNYTTLDANLHAMPNRLLVVDNYLYGIGGDGGQTAGFFKIKKDGTDFHKFTDLNSDNWGYAKGNLLQASNGFVYGINYGDKIFRLNPATDEFSVLFQEPTPESCLRTCMENIIETPDGMLSGVQNFSSRLNKISLDGSGFQSYAFFELSGESHVVGPLILDDNGVIHAQSRSHYDEGLGVNGIVSFTLQQNYAEMKSVYSFDLGARASYITKGNTDEVYALMQDGGGTQNGTILKIASSGVTKLADTPIGFLEENIVDGGNEFIYGVAFGYPEQLGNHALRINKLTGNFEHFLFESQYFGPGKLLAHSDGQIYGVSEGGGSPRKGFVFKVNSDLSSIVNLHNGSDAVGKVPLGKLVEGSDGSLYSTFRTGGSTLYGTIFKVSTSGTHTTLHEFDNKNGRFPNGGLVRDSDGTLYGVTPEGGTYKKGVLYKINEDGSGFTVVYHFGSDVPNPGGELVMDSEGYLYGRAGSEPNFKIFKIKKDGTELTTLLEGSDIRLYFFGGSKQTQAVASRKEQPDEEFSETNRRDLVKISPNPFTSSFSVEVLDQSAPARVSIIDISGRELYQGPLSADTRNELGENLSAGFYLIRVLQGRKEDVHRLIKK